MENINLRIKTFMENGEQYSVYDKYISFRRFQKLVKQSYILKMIKSFRLETAYNLFILMKYYTKKFMIQNSTSFK